MKKLNESRNTARLPMPAKVKKGFRVYSSLMLAMALVTGMSIHAFAAGDPITVINNLSDFIAGGVVITFAKEILTLITG